MTQSNPRAPIYVALMVCVVTFLAVAPAFAQGAAMLAQSSPGVDFTPIVSNLWGFAVAILTLLAGLLTRVVIGWVSSKTKLTDNQFEALLASRADDILHKAIQNADMWMKEQIADPNSPIKNVQVNNMWMRIAAQYANRSMPDIIRHFGWTPEDVVDKIKTRLSNYVSMPQADANVISIENG